LSFSIYYLLFIYYPKKVIYYFRSPASFPIPALAAGVLRSRRSEAGSVFEDNSAPTRGTEVMGNSATILSEWPDCRVTVTRSQRHYCSDGVSPGGLSLSPGAHFGAHFLVLFSSVVANWSLKWQGKPVPLSAAGPVQFSVWVVPNWGQALDDLPTGRHRLLTGGLNVFKSCCLTTVTR
jgi:hypothetical protein